MPDSHYHTRDRGSVRVYHCIHCRQPGGTLQKFDEGYAHVACHQVAIERGGGVINKAPPATKAQMVERPGQLIVPAHGLFRARKKLPKIKDILK